MRRLALAFASFAVVSFLLLAAYAIAHKLRKVPVTLSARIAYFERVVKRDPSAANWRDLGTAYADNEQFTDASIAFHKSAEIFRYKGDLNGFYANDRRSQRYETDVRVFFHRATERAAVRNYYTGAKFEPVYGCYTGAFIDHEDSIHGTYTDEYGQWRRDVSAFNHLVGSKQAIFFMYLGYGRKFPTKFVTHVNDNGAAAQIAMEPDDLQQVKDDAYIHEFAAAAKASKTPIFLRFASEFNGDWTPYHKSPEEYREKFRLVAKIMHEEAPNVGMVWCPFEIPISGLEAYYPGKDAVDWVGVNIYSVPFLNNERDHGAEWRNPSDALRFVYEKYSAKHPIMIAEYAASHMSSLDMVPRTEFARDKIGQMYASLPRVYPRVKAICWLSMNAVKHAMPGRQKNNYALLDDDAVRKRYEQMLYTPYFLNAVSRHEPAISSEEIVPLHDGQSVTGKVGLSAWVKTYEDRPMVVWKVNGQELRRDDIPGSYHWTLDTATLPDGPATIELVVTDSKGRSVSDISRSVVVSNKR